MANDKVQIAQVYRGTFVHSTQNTPLEILEDRILGVGTDGKVRVIYLSFLTEFYMIIK